MKGVGAAEYRRGIVGIFSRNHDWSGCRPLQIPNVKAPLVLTWSNQDRRARLGNLEGARQLLTITDTNLFPLSYHGNHYGEHNTQGDQEQPRATLENLHTHTLLLSL